MFPLSCFHLKIQPTKRKYCLDYKELIRNAVSIPKVPSRQGGRCFGLNTEKKTCIVFSNGPRIHIHGQRIFTAHTYRGKIYMEGMVIHHVLKIIFILKRHVNSYNKSIFKPDFHCTVMYQCIFLKSLIRGDHLPRTFTSFPVVLPLYSSIVII